MKKGVIKHIPLPAFIALGIVLWFLIFWLSPAYPTQEFSMHTISFIGVSLVVYFLGYLVVKEKLEGGNSIFFIPKTIWCIVLVVVVSWLLRYLDVFYNRGVSFSNTIHQNRNLFKVESLSIVFIVASIIKELYFAPLLLSLVLFKDNKPLVISSSFLFVFPLIIPFSRGTRKDVVLVCLFLLVILLVTKTIFLKAKTVLILLILGSMLNVVLYGLLMRRESPKFETNNTEQKIVTLAKYNNLFKPSEQYIHQMNNSDGLKKAFLFNYLHLSQYYCHGVFELNYLVKNKLETKNYTKGKYMFKLFYKFFDWIGLSKDKKHKKVDEYLPRQNVYITFMGALFLDYGWIGLLGMFFLGFFQKMIDNKVKQKAYMFLIIYCFFIIFNLFFPVINLLRGTGLYCVIAFMLLITISNIAFKFKKRMYS